MDEILGLGLVLVFGCEAGKRRRRVWKVVREKRCESEVSGGVLVFKKVKRMSAVATSLCSIC